MPNLFQDRFGDWVINVYVPGKNQNQTKCIYMKPPDYNPYVMNRCDLPPCHPDYMRLLIISDTHERHYNIGKLPASDLFIHCGDILMTSKLLFHLTNFFRCNCNFDII